MSNDPVLIAFTARRSKRSRHIHWQPIGCAYPHAEGAGLTVILNFMPLDGRIVLLELDDNDRAWIRQQPKTSSRNPLRKLIKPPPPSPTKKSKP